MKKFYFISDDVLRSMIERDKEELDKCLENKINKSALLLSGSIIEAILVDYFINFPLLEKTEEQVLKASLGVLIDWAFEAKLISERSKELSKVIRSYRNLILPGREYRQRENVDIQAATIAYNLVEIIVKEISENYSERKGFTAEQAIKKINLDRSSSSIFPHLLENMSKSERIKLFRIIPIEARIYVLDPSEQIILWRLISNGYPVRKINAIIDLHTQVSKLIPENIIREEVKKVYDNIQNNTMAEAVFLLRFFYDHLQLLESNKLIVVLTYLLNILNNEETDIPELYILSDWGVYKCGKYLNSEEGKDLLFSFLQNSVHSISSEKEEAFFDILEEIFCNINDDVREQIVSRLNKSFQSRLKEWAKKIDGFTSIPF